MSKPKVTAKCPVRTTLEMLGGKWKLLILQEIGEKEVRFGELKKLIPDISEKMLVQELKNLVDSELINRKNYGEVPPKVGYTLTSMGKKALLLIDHIRSFGLAYMNELNHKNKSGIDQV